MAAAILGTAFVLFAASGPLSAEMTSRRFDTSDGVSLHVLEAKPASARPGDPVIALVPGWGMPASIWRAQLESLGKRYTVVALDPRGQGQSAVPEGGYTLERRTADLREFLQAYPRVVLVGWSLGALEALEYVRRDGEARLAGLVLVDSSVGENPRPGKSDFLDRLKRDREATLDGFVRAIFRTPPPEDQVRALVAGAQRMSLEASVALLSYPVPREHWRDVARGVEAPLLYVVTPQFSAQAANLKKNRPATQVVVFAGAGHALFVDEPTKFDAVLGDFVEKVWRAR